MPETPVYDELLLNVTASRIEPLPVATPELCDGHASGGTSAAYTVILPNGGMLFLCGHCTRLHFDKNQWPDREDKMRGSDH